MLRGQPRVIAKGTGVTGPQKRKQFGASDLDGARAGADRPYPPSYPSPALLRGAESEWQLSLAMQVSVRCSGVSVDIRVPADCAARAAALAQRRPSYQTEH